MLSKTIIMTLTPEELEKIKSMHSEFMKGKAMLGDLELAKQEVLADIAKIKQSFESHERELIEKYGDNVTINMKTGEIKNKQI